MHSQNSLAPPVPHPRVGVGVLIVDQLNRVLLTLRNLPPESGYWSIVGGKLEYLETLQDCAVREALEEVGVDVAIESLFCVTDHLLPQENQHWVSPAYLGRVASGRAKNCEPQKNSRSSLVPSRSTPLESHDDCPKRNRRLHPPVPPITQSPRPLML